MFASVVDDDALVFKCSKMSWNRTRWTSLVRSCRSLASSRYARGLNTFWSMQYLPSLNVEFWSWPVLQKTIRVLVLKWIWFTMAMEAPMFFRYLVVKVQTDLLISAYLYLQFCQNSEIQAKIGLQASNFNAFTLFLMSWMKNFCSFSKKNFFPG